MRFLFLGDIVGRSGRDAVCDFVPRIRKERSLDFVVVNGENAAGGFGITPAICDDFFRAGIDVITTGNHVWDQQEIIPFIAKEKRLLRPQNFPASAPGFGSNLYTNAAGKRLAVIHLQGQVFMAEHLPCPFETAQQLLKTYTLHGTADAILVDIHAEANSEKMALAYFLNGKVSAVIGTHTHVPTADAQVLNGGTAYQTDAGMCGDYQSVIGMEQTTVIDRFVTKISKGKRMTPAAGVATVCGAIIETDDATGLATSIESIRVGGILDAKHVAS